ncbi:hypothetical protein [Jidongwangia harbinensis]|uniref:hypothetical protein n=1 Tax=Jidongwangia harbinensis TaxID=2878561 RepID=UPI003557923F
MLSNGHAGFGGRPEETDRSKGRHRASGRPNRAERKKHNAALICLARRRIDVLHAMLRTQTTYQHKPVEKLALAA